MKKALIVWGGWKGHEPYELSEVFKKLLIEEDFEVEVCDTLDAFKDREKLMNLNLIVPIWTMGQINNEQLNPVLEAVESGVGLAGCHGGMCDAFRNCVQWQFMTGGQWVAHPGSGKVEYTVDIISKSNPIVEGIDSIRVVSEQYYLHVDPAVEVLATTTFPVASGPHTSNGKVDMPVIWTKRWGKGKVFYNSLGHHADIFNDSNILEITRRGFLWAAK